MSALSSQQLKLLVLTATIWMLVGSVALVKFRMKASGGLELTLTTKPKLVRININGQPYSNGQYLSTPLSLYIKHGVTKIKILREGYRSHTTTVEKNQGERLRLGEVILLKKAKFEQVPIEVISDRITSPYYVEIDRGFLQGETPLIGFDLPLRGRHIVEIYPDGLKAQSKFRCTFTVAELGSQGPVSIDKVKIKIQRKPDGKLQVSGCVLEGEENR
jgi:hypothetical protein